MPRRFCGVLAALVVALVPSLRALCDVNCLPAPAEAAPAAHCPSTGATDTPVPADDCRHEHAAADVAVQTGAKVSVAPLTAAILDHTPRAVVGFMRVFLDEASRAPDPPPPLRPLPLRI